MIVQTCLSALLFVSGVEVPNELRRRRICNTTTNEYNERVIAEDLSAWLTGAEEREGVDAPEILAWEVGNTASTYDAIDYHNRVGPGSETTWCIIAGVYI